MASVAECVECYWFLHKNVITQQDNHYPRLNPDPSLHLILTDSEYLFNYRYSSKVFKGKGSHLMTPTNQSVILDHSRPFRFLGVKFRVGATCSFPNTLTANEVHTSGDLIDLFQPHLSSRLLDLVTADPQACAKEMDKVFEAFLSNHPLGDDFWFVNQCVNAGTQVKCKDIAKQLGISQRSLERKFRGATGLTFKQWQLMERLEQVLEFFSQNKNSEVDLAKLALDFGFSDQAHFSRFVKQHMGLTPNRYYNDGGFTIDIYGGLHSFEVI